jgi:hypothetical protein
MFASTKQNAVTRPKKKVIFMFSVMKPFNSMRYMISFYPKGTYRVQGRGKLGAIFTFDT